MGWVWEGVRSVEKREQLTSFIVKRPEVGRHRRGSRGFSALLKGISFFTCSSRCRVTPSRGYLLHPGGWSLFVFSLCPRIVTNSKP